MATILLGMVQRLGGVFAAGVAHGQIETDAIQPGVKCGRAAECLEFEKGLDKGVLRDVAGVFSRTEDAKQRVEKPVLVREDEPSKRGRLPREGRLNQLAVVERIVFAQANLEKLDVASIGKVPADNRPGHTECQKNRRYAIVSLASGDVKLTAGDR